MACLNIPCYRSGTWNCTDPNIIVKVTCMNPLWFSPDGVLAVMNGPLKLTWAPSTAMPWLADDHGTALQSSTHLAEQRPSLLRLLQELGFYSMPAFSSYASTEASILFCLGTMALYKVYFRMICKQDTDVGHRGCEGMPRTRWQDEEF